MRKALGLGIAAVVAIAIVFAVGHNNNDDVSVAPESALDSKVRNIAGGEVAQAGADTFVAGSAIFGKENYTQVIDAMRTELGKSGKA